MASKKRKKKIANEGGYNYERNNPHIQRKKNKVRLKKAEYGWSDIGVSSGFEHRRAVTGSGGSSPSPSVERKYE